MRPFAYTPVVTVCLVIDKCESVNRIGENGEGFDLNLTGQYRDCVSIGFASCLTWSMCIRRTFGLSSGAVAAGVTDGTSRYWQ